MDSESWWIIITDNFSWGKCCKYDTYYCLTYRHDLWYAILTGTTVKTTRSLLQPPSPATLQLPQLLSSVYTAATVSCKHMFVLTISRIIYIWTTIRTNKKMNDWLRLQIRLLFRQLTACNCLYLLTCRFDLNRGINCCKIVVID